MTIQPGLALYGVPGLPIIQPGDDLAGLIADALKAFDLALQAGDVLIITSKIVSKAEGRFVALASVTPSPEALRLAEITGKDPRMVELVLRESTVVSRAAPNVLVVRHRLGFVSANAGIDQSNVDGGDDIALLLPLDPDESARRLREQLTDLAGVAPAIIVSDSHGRPFRMGNVGVAIGAAGLPALRDLRGQRDLFGRVLKISLQALGDEIASAANLLSGEGAEGLPVVLLRGLHFAPADGCAADLVRPPEQDLFRN
ncbi:MAG TPA: coenzyme F420-0:L-glutamate ligase [Candidatus Limnocylindrales bacterium]|nr:coenzyme F420-0:L-glutamate ligase [Candidatus Limnocylindrales bacterium]